MKKLFLSVLLVIPCLSAQPNHVHSSRYIEYLKTVVAGAKELVQKHPYAVTAFGVATVAAAYWYANQDEDEVELSAYYLAGSPCERGELRKPGWSYASIFGKKQTPPPAAVTPDSPDRKSPEFKDFTGEFIPMARSNLHPQELRHN